MILAEMSVIGESLLEISAMGAVLIGLLVLLRRIAGQRLTPGCYLAMWALIGVRLLLPVNIASSFSVYNLLTAKSLSPAGTMNSENVWPDPDIQTAVLPDNGIVPDSRFSDWLFLIWLVGAVICFFYMLSSHWRCRRWYAASLPLETAFVQEWKQEH